MATPLSSIEAALREEERYEALQETKKKAAAEGVEYEQFAERVRGAHLVPVREGALYSAAATTAAKCPVAGLTARMGMLGVVAPSQEGMEGRGRALAEERELAPPASADEFERRLAAAGDPHAYLDGAGAARLEELYSAGLGFDSLAPILRAKPSLEVLTVLAATPRFDMVAGFLERDEAELAARVLDDLGAGAELRRRYTQAL